jgi:hypothetical protein
MPELSPFISAMLGSAVPVIITGFFTYSSTKSAHEANIKAIETTVVGELKKLDQAREHQAAAFREQADQSRAQELGKSIGAANDVASIPDRAIKLKVALAMAEAAPDGSDTRKLANAARDSLKHLAHICDDLCGQIGDCKTGNSSSGACGCWTTCESLKKENPVSAAAPAR